MTLYIFTSVDGTAVMAVGLLSVGKYKLYNVLFFYVDYKFVQTRLRDCCCDGHIFADTDARGSNISLIINNSD